MRAISRSLLFAAILSTLVLTASAVAFADCTAPSSPGVRICSPTANATVSYPAAIDLAITPSSGASVVKFSIYDNNVKRFDSYPGQTGGMITDFAVKNGFHHIVVNAWDTNGNLYQAQRSFTVTGEGFQTFCTVPSTPGINFCVPPPGAIFSINVPVSASARGYSRITAMRLYVDGQARQTITDTNQASTAVNVGTQANHNVTWVAWDSGGHVFTSSKTVRPAYTYGYVDCPPRGTDPCSPGFGTTTMPPPNSYVFNSFRLQANIQNNPRPIATMKAYIDNTLVATSNGPVMDYPVENAPNGTHILTFQAWDTSGVLYRIQYNININVPH